MHILHVTANDVSFGADGAFNDLKASVEKNRNTNRDSAP
jgi:hypothetical protein